MFGEILQKFVKKTPIAVMVQGLMERLLNAEELDRWFGTARNRQYTKEITFSSLIELMLKVVCKLHPSVHSAYRDSSVSASVVAVYDKLKRLEPSTAQALVRRIAAQAGEVIARMGGEHPALLPGYRVKYLDGNSLEATEHRLRGLRETAAGALPGKSLVVFDPATGLAVDVFPCEDAHAQERSLLPAVLETVVPGELWIADRNFCTCGAIVEFTRRGACFVLREHGNLPCRALGERIFIRRTDTGRVYEQPVVVTDTEGAHWKLRRIVIDLDRPTRNGERRVAVLTNLPRAHADAAEVAERYRGRWGIETAFQKLERHLHSEINPLGYPKAALFGFCLALVAFNLHAVVMAALRAAHPQRAINDEVSEYYLALEIANTHEGMLIAVPEAEWTVFSREDDPEALSRLLVHIASQAPLKKYKKTPRGPKKPRPARQRFKNEPHVATARVLAETGRS